jgi:hypothetical protein
MVLELTIANEIPSNVASLPTIFAQSRMAIDSRRAETQAMEIGSRRKRRTAIVGLIALLLAGPASATTLISVQESNLPPDDSRLRSGIERGPDIIAVYPAPRSGAIQSPFDFRVKFQAHGNTQIDLDSLNVVYKRIPAIDLTARVKPFVRPDGIDMPIAEVPPGTHRILILVKDSAGHEGQADIRFDVEK